MRIIKVEIEEVLAGDIAHLLIVLHSDNGLVGVGETTSTRAPKMLRAVIEAVADDLVGCDPFNWNGIVQRLERSSDPEFLVALRNGIEAACLDLTGKQLGVPAFQLFGGAVRTKIRVCATDWQSGGDSPEDLARKAVQLVNAGFTALEVDPFASEVAYMRWRQNERAKEIVCRVRIAVGGSIDLIVNAKGRFSASQAVVIAEDLLPYHPLYLQDPVISGDLKALEALRRATPVPIAIGGYTSNGEVLREAIESQLADFCHLDCVRLGGISRVREFALLAESWFMNVTLHHGGGPVAWAANAQIAASMPNFLMADLPYPVPDLWREVLDPAIEIETGCVRPSHGAGLGVNCDA